LSPELRQRFLQLVRELAVLRGDFTLASGEKATYFFDMKMVTLHPEGAYLVGKLVYESIADAAVDAVGGLTLGADPIAAAVAVVSHMEGRPIPAFIERGGSKDHGTQKSIEGYMREGSRVVIVEDVITKGGATLKAIELAEAAGCRVVKVVALVDRHRGGSDEVRRRGYDFVAILHADAGGELSLG